MGVFRLNGNDWFERKKKSGIRITIKFEINVTISLGAWKTLPTPSPTTIWYPINFALDVCGVTVKSKPEPTAAIAGPESRNGQ